MKKFWAFYIALPMLLLTLLFVGGLPSSSAAAPGAKTTEPYVFDIPVDSPDPNETLRLVNQTRLAAGATPLAADATLAAVAAARAADMAERQYYAHKDPDGRYYYDYFAEHAVQAKFSCENLDLVFVPSQELVISEWQASLKGHRSCMMHDKTTRAGYATTRLTLVDFNGKETLAYLVVAIHAEPEN